MSANKKLCVEMYWWIRVSPQFWMTRIPYLKKAIVGEQFFVGLWSLVFPVVDVDPTLKSMKEMGCESRILLKGEPENAMRFLDASCRKKQKTPLKVPESFFLDSNTPEN